MRRWEVARFGSEGGKGVEKHEKGSDDMDRCLYVRSQR